MAIQVQIMNVLNGAQNASLFMYEVKEFLKSIGWTVAGSSNGTVGGMDAVDRITTSTLSNTDRWFVLQSPHASPSDRIQLFFGKSSSNALNGKFRYNPNADYAGVTTAAPTSAYESPDVMAATIAPSSDGRYHLLADDAAPYGFALLFVALSTQSPTLMMALNPLDFRAPTTPGKPYVFIAEANATGATLSSPDTGKVAEPDAPPKVPQAAPPCYVNSSAGVLVPNGTPQTSDGRDQSSPMIFHSTTEYFGVSSNFMRWNGSARNNLDTLEDDVLGVRGRIVFGDANFPWDGTTIPNSTTII